MGDSVKCPECNHIENNVSSIFTCPECNFSAVVIKQMKISKDLTKNKL